MTNILIRFLLGSPLKKENIDANLQIANSPMEDMNQGIINNGWNKVSEKGDTFLKICPKFSYLYFHHQK